MQDLAINLLASVIAGSAVWIAQYLVRYRTVARKRAFFGVRPGDEVNFFVSKHASSPRPNSVHRNDVAAMVELATAVKECGGRSVLASDGDTGADRVTEYCVGGPTNNTRSAAYIRTALPGVTFLDSAAEKLSFSVGDKTFHRTPDRAEYVLLARMHGPWSPNPVFLVLGQTARTNLAAARYLTDNSRHLSRMYPPLRNFCLVLLIREPATFGTDHVELVADLTTEAFTSMSSEPS